MAGSRCSYTILLKLGTIQRLPGSNNLKSQMRMFRDFPESEQICDERVQCAIPSYTATQLSAYHPDISSPTTYHLSNSIYY